MNFLLCMCVIAHAALFDATHCYATVTKPLGYDSESPITSQDHITLISEPYMTDFTQHLWTWSLHKGPIGSEEFTFFIDSLYNNPRYAQNYLPNNFSDLLRFLQYGNQTDKNRTYVQQVIRLFGNKVKSSRYINPDALYQLLDALPNLLKRHALEPSPFPFDLVRQQVEATLRKHTQQSSTPETTCVLLTDTISQEIAEILERQHAHLATQTSKQELQKTVLIFLELCIGKLVWSPDDGIESWHITKKIGHKLMRLMEFSTIADADDLNDLFISLVERYCYFVELMADELRPDFYTIIADELKSNVPLFLDFQEQEPMIEKKLSRLQRTLAQCEEVSALAYTRKQLQINAEKLADEHGIIMGKLQKPVSGKVNDQKIVKFN